MPHDQPTSAILLGSGFNADAKDEAGTIMGLSIYIGPYEIQCRYPMVSDALQISFGVTQIPEGRSIEDLYADALREGNHAPINRLCDELMKADYYIVPRLWSNESSSYYRFFSRYRDSTFLTFNYDALAELFLLRLGVWYPHDGYGVDVDVELGPNIKGISRSAESQTLVLHLHGSFCLYPSDAFVEWDDTSRHGTLRLRERPRYIFDPDSIGLLFTPFERVMPALGYVEPARRVVAPVPNKASGLRAAFVSDVYRRAKDLLRDVREIVAIGYSFGPHDRVAFDPIIRTFASGGGERIVVVTPEADAIVIRMQEAYPIVTWVPVPLPFANWANTGFGYSADA